MFFKIKRNYNNVKVSEKEIIQFKSRSLIKLNPFSWEIQQKKHFKKELVVKIMTIKR